MLQFDVLIFDMDGVLIDVSESYRDAIRKTAQLYLEAAMGLSPCDGELVSREDVTEFKLAGGFNNDWDLTTGILKYFVALLPTSAVLETAEVSKATTQEIVAFLRQAGKQISTTSEMLRQRKDIRAFADALRAQGGGLAAVHKILGDRNGHLVFANGELRHSNLVKRIFEEVYLGEELFRQEYGDARLVYHGDGLIQRERLISNPQSLIALSQRVALGIATGRPRKQAVYALERFGIRDLFRALVTLEDIVAAEQRFVIASEAKQSPSYSEIASAHKPRLAMTDGDALGHRISLSKPHPFALLEAARRLTTTHARCAYIGDTPDDIRAANAAKGEMDFVSIGCLVVAENKDALRREFEHVGVDIIVNHPDELADMIAK